MRLVVDTNVFVAAVSSADGASREVFRRCLKGVYTPLMGQALFSEYEDLLGRSKVFEASPVSTSDRQALFAALMSVAVWSRVYYLWRPNLPDEADNHVLELAVAGGAQAIVTYNTRDFSRSELYFPEVAILKPAELLQVGES